MLQDILWISYHQQKLSNPFTLDHTQDKYKRKYDEDLQNELRILEELHYHCLSEPLYITELRSALKDQGLLDDNLQDKELTIKEKFKETNFFKSGIIYLNTQEINDYKNTKSFEDLNVKRKSFEYDILSNTGKETYLLKDLETKEKTIQKKSKIISIKKIPKHIIQKALAKNDFYRFNLLQKYFPTLESMQSFIDDDNFLGGLEIIFWGIEKDLLAITNQDYLQAMMGLLTEIEKDIKGNLSTYYGSSDFKPHLISKTFFNKTLRLDKNDERFNGQEDFIENKDWYVFNANYGTSEEKAFVRMLSTQIDDLETQYDEVYLIRNERHFKIFSFDGGRAFEPDFVLLLHNKKTEKNLTYQVFIEPKGSHLIGKDQWKQEFLQEMKEKFKDQIITFNETKKYKITGVPFYNMSDENLFKKDLQEYLD